jgi:hypothetical protein
MMACCARYESVQVTPEDAAFYLIKRTLAELPQPAIVTRPGQPGAAGVATFVAIGVRFEVPMSHAVTTVCATATTGKLAVKSLAAVSGRRVADPALEYRETLRVIDETLSGTEVSLEVLRGLSVLRGAIATRLTVSSLCMAA